MNNAINWPMIGIGIAGLLITMITTLWLQSKAAARQQGRQDEQNKAFAKDIHALAGADKSLAEKLDKAIDWGKSMIEERTKYNEKTYLRKDMFRECHVGLERKVEAMTTQVTKLIESDTPVRLATIEATMEGIRIDIEKVQTTQDEILKALLGK